VRERALHTVVVAFLFILGWVIVGWPLMGLFLAILSGSDLAAIATFVVYVIGFFSIYFAYLKRRNFAPWRVGEN